MSTEISELEQEIDTAVEQTVQELAETQAEEKVIVEKEDTPGESVEDTHHVDEGRPQDLGDFQRDTQKDSGEGTQKDDTSGEAVGEPSGEAGKEGESKGEDEISPAALARAMGNGLSLSEARSFETDGALEDFSNRLEYIGQQQALTQQQEQQQQQQQQQEVFDPFSNLPKLDPENFDPEVITMFDQLTNIVKGQHETIESFRTNQQEVALEMQGANRAEVESFFDEQVKNLGEDYQDVLGAGKYSDLNQSSSEFLKRDEIASQMSIIIAGHQHQGMEVPPRAEVFKAATQIVLADKIAELKHNKLSNELKEQATQHIQRVNKSNVASTLTDEQFDVELGAEIDQKFSG